MTGRSDHHERLQDYLDGLLTPAEEAEVRTLLEESREARQAHDELAAVYSVLDTSLDVEPPSDLVAGVFAALQTEAARRLHLPVRLERGLVLAGAASLAGIVALAGPLAQPAGWIGRLTVAATQALAASKDALVGFGSTLAYLDWVARLVSTLSDAARTVLASSAEPLIALSMTSVALTTLVAYWLWRTERGFREGVRSVPLVF
jgi:predicted anti-sigma-YlaC factor YlaD